MNIKNSILTMLLAGTLCLSGCGSAGNGTANNAANNATTSTNQPNQTTQSTPDTKSDTNQDTTAIQQGVDKMLAIATQLKSAASKGDVQTVKATGPKLEDEWRTFEDHVKPKYPDLYAKVEQYLDPTIAGSQAAQLNKQALTLLDNNLIDALQALKAKVKG